MTIKRAPIRLVLVGCDGRMGAAVTAAAQADEGCSIVGRINRMQRQLPENTDNAVVVDFSSDSGAQAAINTAQELETPLLTGTTGLSVATIQALEALSHAVPVACVSNTSTGIALLRHLMEIACSALRHDDRLDVELLETHHTHKRDAPSGTALSLAKSLANIGLEFDPATIRSHREENVVGEHELRLSIGSERLILKHEALDRSLFADGAIQLARSLSQRDPGLYQAADLLDFSFSRSQ
jgi:4-hydroxy-tetrahydrodipicolinate reductase